MITTRSAAALAAAAFLAVLAAGCASHGNAPGADATRPPGTSTTAAPAAASTRAATAPGGQAAVPRCHTSQLSMAFTGLNAAMGGVRTLPGDGAAQPEGTRTIRPNTSPASIF